MECTQETYQASYIYIYILTPREISCLSMHNRLVSYHMSDSMKLHSRENSYELINQYWVCPNIWYMGLLIQNKKYGKVTFHKFVDISEDPFKRYVTLPRGTV